MRLDRLDDWLVSVFGQVVTDLLTNTAYALLVLLLAKWILL